MRVSIIFAMSGGEFSYRGGSRAGEAPFEVFLRYTNEKEAAAERLAPMLEAAGPDECILDIGAGNGEHLDLALSRMTGLTNARLALLDASPGMAARLQERFASRLPEDRLSVYNTTFEDFSTDERFDIVLAAHLFYNLPRAAWQQQLGRMLDLLQPNGKLVEGISEFGNALRRNLHLSPSRFRYAFDEAMILFDQIVEIFELPHRTYA